jgi:O-antigen ligase
VDNFWLHLLAEVGVLGTVLFGLALTVAAWEALVAARAAGGWRRVACGAAGAMAVVIAVDSVTEMLLEGNTTSFPTWFFLGVASALAAGAAKDLGASTPRDR